MRARRVSIVVVTVIEAPAVYVWLRLDEAGHDWWGLLILVPGEALETALALRLITTQGGKDSEAVQKDSAGAHLKKVQLQVGAGCAAEIGIWLLWLALADEVGQPVAAGVLFALMHVKHHVELSAVRDTPFANGLFSVQLTFASAMEAGGAVACLAWLHDGRPVLAAVAWGVGLSIEHTILVGSLHREMERRDVRLPRKARS